MSVIPSHEGFRATATQLVRDFPEVRRMADRGPVHITSRGRTELVMLNPDEFAKIVDNDCQDAERLTWKLSILLDTVDTSVLILDDDMIVRRANRALCSVLEADESELVGQHVSIMVAHPSDRYLVDRLHDVHRSHLTEVLTIPSTRNPGRILQLTIKPWPKGVAMFCDDVTEHTRFNDMTVAAEASDHSLAALGGVGNALIRSSGEILSASMGLAVIVGTSACALAGSRLQNLFAVQSRGLVSEALVQTNDGARTYDVEYLKNGMTPSPATLAVTPYWTAEHHACASIALLDPNWR